jgi:hypothetical protein
LRNFAGPRRSLRPASNVWLPTNWKITRHSPVTRTGQKPLKTSFKENSVRPGGFITSGLAAPQVARDSLDLPRRLLRKAPAIRLAVEPLQDFMTGASDRRQAPFPISLTYGDK